MHEYMDEDALNFWKSSLVVKRFATYVHIRKVSWKFNFQQLLSLALMAFVMVSFSFSIHLDITFIHLVLFNLLEIYIGVRLRELKQTIHTLNQRQTFEVTYR